MKKTRKFAVYALLTGASLLGIGGCLEQALYHALVIQVSDQVGGIGGIGGIFGGIGG